MEIMEIARSWRNGYTQVTYIPYMNYMLLPWACLPALHHEVLDIARFTVRYLIPQFATKPKVNLAPRVWSLWDIASWSARFWSVLVGYCHRRYDWDSCWFCVSPSSVLSGLMNSWYSCQVKARFLRLPYHFFCSLFLWTIFQALGDNVMCHDSPFSLLSNDQLGHMSHPESLHFFRKGQNSKAPSPLGSAITSQAINALLLSPSRTRAPQKSVADLL